MLKYNMIETINQKYAGTPLLFYFLRSLMHVLKANSTKRFPKMVATHRDPKQSENYIPS